jgi:hypothetical protein
MAAILASLHLWLRELESTYAGKLIIYLGLFDPDAPRPALPAHLERKLAARWQECRREVLFGPMEYDSRSANQPFNSFDRRPGTVSRDTPGRSFRLVANYNVV